jgi:sterol desaturase/sphingolipid hydroxylase (fatty acid hydroxylase superfamily)
VSSQRRGRCRSVAPKLVVATLSLNLLYQFWIHVTWIPKLGWLEYVLNTPSAHRVHHASNPEYIDANFGGVLILRSCANSA